MPPEFQVAMQRAFGVLLAIKALAGHAMRNGDKNEHPFVMGRHGNRIMAQAKCDKGHTRTLHKACQAAIAVSLGLLAFCLGHRGNKQARGMHGSLLGIIEKTSDTAKAPGEKGAKKGQISGTTPGSIIDVRSTVLDQLIPGTSPTWFDKVEAICDLKAL